MPPLSQQDINAIVTLHNDARKAIAEQLQIHVDPLIWAPSLAQHAQAWADHLANAVHKLKHAKEEGRLPKEEGENIAAGGGGGYPPGDLVRNTWLAEKNNFKAPCSSWGDLCSWTESWLGIGHYTQMVWGMTKEVGFAWAYDATPIPTSWNPQGAPVNWLVARYRPAGNEPNKPVFGHRIFFSAD